MNVDQTWNYIFFLRRYLSQALHRHFVSCPSTPLILFISVFWQCTKLLSSLLPLINVHTTYNISIHYFQVAHPGNRWWFVSQIYILPTKLKEIIHIKRYATLAFSVKICISSINFCPQRHKYKRNNGSDFTPLVTSGDIA